MDGSWQVVRSSDAGFGGHLADPVERPGARQPDGRWSWAAQLEAALFPISCSLHDAESGLNVDPHKQTQTHERVWPD
jgi:hypothetical protein